MRYSTALTVAAAGLASAAPSISKRQAITDTVILQYALTLEHLEDKFYREGLANYSQAAFVAAGFADPFYANLKEISFDETTHVSALTAALGSAAPPELTYAFGVTTPKDFITLASVLEGVGVSAYLGAAPFIADKVSLLICTPDVNPAERHRNISP